MGNKRVDRRGIKFIVVNIHDFARRKKAAARLFENQLLNVFPDCVLPGKKKKRAGRWKGKSRIVISTMDVYHGRWTN